MAQMSLMLPINSIKEIYYLVLMTSITAADKIIKNSERQFFSNQQNVTKLAPYVD